jgi:hypothetical protein
MEYVRWIVDRRHALGTGINGLEHGTAFASAVFMVPNVGSVS